MKNNRGFGLMAVLASLAGMFGYRNDRHDQAPSLKRDREAPPSMRNVNRSCYTRHQGARECARRQRQRFLSHVPNLAAALAQRPISEETRARLWKAA
jgi:hypothetical protein